MEFGLCGGSEHYPLFCFYITPEVFERFSHVDRDSQSVTTPDHCSESVTTPDHCSCSASDRDDDEDDSDSCSSSSSSRS